MIVLTTTNNQRYNEMTGRRPEGSRASARQAASSSSGWVCRYGSLSSVFARDEKTGRERLNQLMGAPQLRQSSRKVSIVLVQI
jgi:hypothetical protein